MMTPQANPLRSELGLLDEQAFADMLRITLRTLRNQRYKGEGPDYVRVNNRIFYPIDKVKQFITASTIKASRTPSLVDGKRQRAR